MPTAGIALSIPHPTCMCDFLSVSTVNSGAQIKTDFILLFLRNSSWYVAELLQCVIMRKISASICTKLGQHGVFIATAHAVYTRYHSVSLLRICRILVYLVMPPKRSLLLGSLPLMKERWIVFLLCGFSTHGRWKFQLSNLVLLSDTPWVA